MHIYYVAGLPYSDELSHSGVKGMKWGIRRYQNEDGTLTPLGKIHYGVGKAAGAVGRAAKAVGARRVQKFKDRHKWVMSDEELQKRIERVSAEKRYKDLLKDTGPQKKGRKLIGEILSEGAKTLGRTAFNQWAKMMFEKDDSLTAVLLKDIVEKEKEEYGRSHDLPDIEKIRQKADILDEVRRLEGKSSKKTNKGKGGGG